MSAAAPTIWMNVTTSATWNRPPVGIVRVERSLAGELSKLYGSQFKQCVWRDGEFVEWTSPPMSQQSALTQQEVQPGTAALPVSDLPPIFPLLPRRKALVAIAQGLLSLMPARLRPSLNRALYRWRPRIDGLISSRWIAKIRSRVHRTATSFTSRSFSTGEPTASTKIGVLSPGDILISIGLDWNSNFYKSFYFFRKEKRIRVVTCCYDLIPVIYPQYCVGDVATVFTSYFLDVADGSDLVLCISRQTERDFLELMEKTGGAIPRTHVFPLGDNVPLAAEGNVSQEVREIIQTPFILFVSTIERRKNHEVLYRAYHLLCAEGKRAQLPKLVFVGMQGWGVNDLLEDIKVDPLTRGLIIRLNHVNDAELRELYESAKFCVFPSLYEGWGLPVGEALALGKALIASERGSLPEVAGDLVRYISPWSPRDWADEMYRMTVDNDWRLEWETKARTQYHERTWAEAGISVKNAVDEILLKSTICLDPKSN